MSQLKALYQRLAGHYNFVSVKPLPVAGPFPSRVVENMGIILTHTGGLDVYSPINSGDGGFVMTVGAGGNEPAAIITFTSTSWTERALVRVEGDDANGTLMSRMEEAEEFLQARLSRSAGAYELTLRETEDEHELVITSSNDGAVLTFRAQHAH